MLTTRVDETSEERRRTAPRSNLKTWRIPQCPFQMECSSSVLEQIRQEVEGAHNSRRGELETGGVLFGIQEPGRICILAAKALQCEHAMGPGFVLSEKDEKHLAQLISARATDPELNGLQTLGWYHSHIRSRIFLSERDLQIQSGYFAAPFQIALVIHPKSDGPTRAGFFFHETSGEMRAESSYEEFTIGAPPLPAAPELRQASKPAPAHKRTPPQAKREPQQTEAICLRCASKHLRPSRKTGPVEQVSGFFGYYPYRCNECLSRSFLKTSSNLLELARATSRKRPEERKRARQRARREILLWGGAVVSFLVILYYMIRDTGAKPDMP